MALEMSNILRKLGHNDTVIQRFSVEKVTPDTIRHLSLHELNSLGVLERTDIMKLRIECLCYNSHLPRVETNGSFQISRFMIESLFEAGYSVKDTCIALGVSESTMYRKMRQFGLSKYTFTEIDENELIDIVSKTIAEYPRCGEELLRRLLFQKGVKVQRFHLRACLHRIDETGIRKRSRRRLRRRTYAVAGPNHLWHIDSNHKLIRWHFVIIGGIDGFSRLITYLKCADNNRATTILECFQEGVSKYGIPERVRSDQGRENTKVADFMISARGTGRGSMIVGKSTHNQRIERLWRDVYDGVLSYFYELFYFLEDEGFLDVLNETHLYALHYVFLKRLNERLKTWQGAWNHHRIRTVNSTPIRLFTAGMTNSSSDLPHENTNLHYQETESNSDDGLAEHWDSRPTLSTLSVHLSEDRVRSLQQRCSQNWTSDNHGIDIFQTAIRILTE